MAGKLPVKRIIPVQLKFSQIGANKVVPMDTPKYYATKLRLDALPLWCVAVCETVVDAIECVTKKPRQMSDNPTLTAINEDPSVMNMPAAKTMTPKTRIALKLNFPVNHPAIGAPTIPKLYAK